MCIHRVTSPAWPLGQVSDTLNRQGDCLTRHLNERHYRRSMLVCIDVGALFVGSSQRAWLENLSSGGERRTLGEIGNTQTAPHKTISRIVRGSSHLPSLSLSLSSAARLSNNNTRPSPGSDVNLSVACSCRRYSRYSTRQAFLIYCNNLFLSDGRIPSGTACRREARDLHVAYAHV
jgi:hypothetical protein